MGTISHNAILITTWHGGNTSKHDVALQEFCKAFNIPLLGPFKSGINDYITFLLQPDGSKEGWDASDAGDERRLKLTSWLKENKYADYFDWIEVRYGELGNAIEDGNDST